jgi:hypothetical protein
MHRLARPENALVLAIDHVPEVTGFALASDAELSRKVWADLQVVYPDEIVPSGFRSVNSY